MYRLTHSLIVFALIFFHSSAQSSNEKSQTCFPRINYGCDKYFRDEIPSPLQPNHQCEDFIAQKRTNETHLQNLILEDFHTDQNLWKRTNRPRQSLYHIKIQNSNKEFLICTVPKTGCTRMKLLLMRIAGIRGAKVHNKTLWNQNFFALMPKTEQKRILNDPEIVRIRVVRNPYVRALSMYQDKVLKQPWTIDNWGFEKRPPSFHEWIAKYYERKKIGYLFDTHYTPQYDHCWSNLGFQFDYILKIERQNYWFNCFIEKFNLWKYVMGGWDDENHCYFSTPEVPCNGPHQDENGKLVYPEEKLTDGNTQDFVTDSQSRYLKVYAANKSTLAKVSQIFLDDIVMFNYSFLSNSE